MGDGLKRAIRAAKRTRYPGTPEPAPRQVWADNDKRVHPERHVRVDEVIGDFAFCTVIKGRGVGKKTMIKTARMVPNATGYRYLRTEEG